MIVIAGISALMMIMLAAQSFAWGWGDGKRDTDKKDRPAEKIVKLLGLTDDQKKQFDAAHEAGRKDAEPYMQKLKDLSEKLKAELTKETPNKSDAENLVREIGKNRTELEVKRIDSMLDLQKILTPEQKTKFQKMMDHRQGKSEVNPK